MHPSQSARLLLSAVGSLLLIGAAAPAQAYSFVAGGPTWVESTDTGYLYGELPIAPGSAVNDSGTAIGYAKMYSSGTDEGLRAVRWDISANFTKPDTFGTSSSGYTNSGAYAINAAGTSVGYSEKYSGNTDLGERAVRWNASGTAATELASLGANPSGYTASAAAVAINTDGTSVGWSDKYSGNTNLGERAVRWDAAGTAATELASLGTNLSGFTNARAYAMNTAGTSAGWSQKYSGNTNLGERAVRWDAAGTAATELASLGTNLSGFTNAQAYAINAAGTSVGWSEKYSGDTDVGSRAVRWNASGTAATELASLGTNLNGLTNARAYAINGDGTSVGYSEKYSGNTDLGLRAVRWDATGTAATELGSLGTNLSGFTNARAYAINAAGTSVGDAQKYDSSGNYIRTDAVAWALDGAAFDLNDLVDPKSGWILMTAEAISDTGYVAGYGSYDPDGAGPQDAYQRLYVMQLPEPASLSLIAGAGLLLTLRPGRRKET